MRELDVSPVVWPAWCYTGEGQADSDPAAMTDLPKPQSAKSRAKSRQVPTLPPAEHNNNNNTNNNNNNNNSLKTERLSPTTTNVDNTSTSSRSATPSSFAGTPPRQSPGSSPSIVNRNYSDMMRSLAAKYNNSNPNDYFSGPPRNGSTFPVALDPRFTPFKGGSTPFAGLVAPLATTVMPTLQQSKSANATATSATPKHTDAANLHKKSLDAQALYAAAANSFTNHFNSTSAMFPPLMDMSSSQALLNMVRTASAHNASQLETYLKGAIKRPAPSESSPLDLSAAGIPTKRQRKSFSESNFFSNDAFLNIPIVDTLRTKGKRTGSVSPLSRGSNGSSPRLASATMTSTMAGAPVIGRCVSLCGDAQSIAQWTVDDVCAYVTSIEACAEYVQSFRAERIDGTSLPLLTEEHLTTTMSMKLGPALKLRATLARRLGNCAVCSHCLHCHATNGVDSAATPAATLRPSSDDN